MSGILGMITESESAQVDHLRCSHLKTFYELIDLLRVRTGGPFDFGSCGGRRWPERGVYVFFEPGEDRTGSGAGPRVVRVGTHALKTGGKARLWTRLSQHRGGLRAGGGNHRGSIFRLLIGAALIARDPALQVASWGQGSSAAREVCAGESELEAMVSAHIGSMQFLVLNIPDEPGPESLRGYIERNAIAPLSNYNQGRVDPSSPNWLGSFCPRERVQRSHLWNNNHVDGGYDVGFLDVFERLIRAPQI